MIGIAIMAAAAGPVPVPSPPPVIRVPGLPPPMIAPILPEPPPKRWTAEEFTLPLLSYSCDLLGHDARRGKLEFKVNGGRAYPEAQADRQQVPGLGRTKQHVQFGADELGLFHGPVAEDVLMGGGSNRFFVHFTAPDPGPPLHAVKGWRAVVLTYNYGMPLVISVNGVPGTTVATGFCSVVKQEQPPLTREDAAREIGG